MKGGEWVKLMATCVLVNNGVRIRGENAGLGNWVTMLCKSVLVKLSSDRTVTADNRCTGDKMYLYIIVSGKLDHGY